MTGVLRTWANHGVFAKGDTMHTNHQEAVETVLSVLQPLKMQKRRVRSAREHKNRRGCGEIHELCADVWTLGNSPFSQVIQHFPSTH